MFRSNIESAVGKASLSELEIPDTAQVFYFRQLQAFTSCLWVRSSIDVMTDLTPDFNLVLRSKEVPPVIAHRYSIDRLDGFLQEAYNIVWNCTQIIGSSY